MTAEERKNIGPYSPVVEIATAARGVFTERQPMGVRQPAGPARHRPRY